MQKAHFHTEAVSLVDKDELNNSVSVLCYGCGSYFNCLGVLSYLLLHLCFNRFAMVLYWPCCIKQPKENKSVKPSLKDPKQASAKLWALSTYYLEKLQSVFASNLNSPFTCVPHCSPNRWVQGHHIPLPPVDPRLGSVIHSKYTNGTCNGHKNRLGKAPAKNAAGRLTCFYPSAHNRLSACHWLPRSHLLLH